MSTLFKRKVDLIDRLTDISIVSHNNTTSTHFDVVLKWAPIATVLISGIAGFKTKSKFIYQLVTIGAAQGILNGMVQPLKHATNKMRPNMSLKFNSFPSGHTATSFAGAEIMRQELEEYPVINYAGYAAAVTTGIIRLCKRKHWVSDVTAGAVIGIAAARIAYSIIERSKKKIQEK